METKRIRVGAYCRASTLLQESSVSVQTHVIHEFCKARDYDVVQLYKDEGISGLRERRPGLDLLLEDARKRKFDVIVVASIDRLGRSLRHFVNLIHQLQEDYNVRLVSVREQAFDIGTTQGQLFLSIMSLLSEYEVRLTKERIRLALATKKAEAQRTGNGWRCGRKPIDGGLKEKALTLRKEGVSVRQIAKQLGIGKTTVERFLRGRR